MITPSYSITATERVLPKLALDFTTATLDPRVTFARTTGASNPATYVNSSGYVVAATDNQPRFDYNPITLVCKGLLIEESRTNSLTYSEQFDTAATWVPTRASVTGDSVVAPSNAQTADKLIPSVDNNTHFINQTFTFSATTYSYSVYVKAGEYTNVRLQLNDNSGNGIYVDANASTGTLSAVSTFGTGFVSVSSSISAAGNSWYRTTLTATTPAGAGNIRLTSLNNAGTNFFAGNGTDGVYVWGAQLEAGAFATSYIPTTTTALTRNADVATMTGTNFSSWWTATTGATNVLAIPKAITGTNPLFQMDDNTADNVINLRGNAANPELYIKATTDQAQIDAGTIVANTAYKLAGAWNTNSCAAAQNGAAVVTDASATIPTVTQARIGSDGTNYANAWLQKINYWPQRITNNEVQAFSK